MAILREIVGMLDQVAGGGAPATIDLRSLPMSPQDRRELKKALGEGEIQATLNADGLSRICETGVSGVWWTEHRDGDGALIAELLEVTRVPPILESALDDIAAGARELLQRISTKPADSLAGSENETRQ